MKYRTEERTRMVPVDRGGKVHQVEETYTVQVPVAPRDWDAIALGAVRVAASLAVAGAVTWSTVAIGDLLSGAAPTWTAYTIAGVFDMAWVICMVLEWLSRFDRARAKLPVICGWVALVVSVALIAVHGGYSEGSWVLGACGGAVSVVAKGVWTVVMRYSAVKLDPASQAWLDAERRDMNSRLATVAGRRQLARTESRTAAEALALSAGQPDNWTAVPVLDSPVVRRTAPVSRTTDLSGRVSQRAFVRGLLSADPSLSDTDLSEAVRAEYGQDTKQDSIRKAIQRARGDLSRTA
jgi:hypothetical protein